MVSTVDELLAEARSLIADRVRPEDLAAAIAGGAFVVDIRPAEQRRRDGELPGAVVIDRNVLEWRLDPAGAHRLPDAPPAGAAVVVVCHEGCASSLAAATLCRLGLAATDLVGGYEAWRRYSSSSS